MMPTPPSCAMAIARRASVTVSMAAETSGMLSSSSRVRRLFSDASRGRMREWAGRRRTSSKVSAFWITRMESLSRKAALYASGHLPESAGAKMDDNVSHPRDGALTITMNRILLMLLAIAFAAAASAQTYKWADRNGKVQYGDTPPADASSVTRLKTPSGGAAAAPAAAPEGKKDAAKDKALTPEQAFQKRQQDRE